MSTSSSTNMDPPPPKTPNKKRKNELRISQPIHHQNINSNSIDPLHTPQNKKRRLSALNHNKSNKMDIHRSTKPTHIFSTQSLETEQEMLESYRNENVINFSCIGYDSLIRYCEMFKLQEFKYIYHYGLTPKSSKIDRNNHRTYTDDDNGDANGNDDKKHNADEDIEQKQSILTSARINGKREMDEIDKNNHKKHKHKKRKNKKKHKDKKNKNMKETEHYYFSSEALDSHYEKRYEERIPKTFHPSTRLTKTELVNIVRQHFLSTPLLAEMSEFDVIKQFLMFIQNRRNELRKSKDFRGCF